MVRERNISDASQMITPRNIYHNCPRDVAPIKATLKKHILLRVFLESRSNFCRARTLALRRAKIMIGRGRNYLKATACRARTV